MLKIAKCRESDYFISVKPNACPQSHLLGTPLLFHEVVHLGQVVDPRFGPIFSSIALKMV